MRQVKCAYEGMSQASKTARVIHITNDPNFGHQSCLYGHNMKNTSRYYIDMASDMTQPSPVPFVLLLIFKLSAPPLQFPGTSGSCGGLEYFSRGLFKLV